MKRYATTLAISLCFCACSTIQTITPTRVRSHTSSFDASTPAQYPDKTNSGVLTPIWDEGADQHGTTATIVAYAVTGHFLIYVQSLVVDYGDQLAPPLKSVKDPRKLPGVSPFRDQFGNDIWKVDTEHFNKYRQLSLWRKSARAKTGTFTKLLNKI